MNKQHHHLKWSIWHRQLHGTYVIAKKDAMIYYLKPPVFIFGVLFPIFFFLAFTLGREVEPESIVPGMLAMALFFTASAVGPLITPWERGAKTYERLISSPISSLSIILGDVLAGACFGVLLSFIPLALGSGLTNATVKQPAVLFLGIILSAVCFAALGVLLAAPPTENPSQVMMLSNLVRLPLIFISGVFVPLAEMPVWSKSLIPLSPLSYSTDLVRAAFGSKRYFPLWLDILMLAAFTGAFIVASQLFHVRAREKAL